MVQAAPLISVKVASTGTPSLEQPSLHDCSWRCAAVTDWRLPQPPTRPFPRSSGKDLHRVAHDEWFGGVSGAGEAEPGLAGGPAGLLGAALGGEGEWADPDAR